MPCQELTVKGKQHHCWKMLLGPRTSETRGGEQGTNNLLQDYWTGARVPAPSPWLP
jgi:hypothetical protein